jgi:hypothetical protein
MPPDEHACQHAMHNIIVSDDYAADLLLYGRVAIAKLLRLLLHRLADTHWSLKVLSSEYVDNARQS